MLTMNQVQLGVGYKLESKESNGLYNPAENGYILAIRLFYAQGTTRATIKTESCRYQIDWECDSQRNVFLPGIDKDTLFYDERQKPMFHEIGE